MKGQCDVCGTERGRGGAAHTGVSAEEGTGQGQGQGQVLPTLQAPRKGSRPALRQPQGSVTCLFAGRGCLLLGACLHPGCAPCR